MILLNVLIKPLWIFGIDRQVQVVVGAAIYGKYFALVSLVFIFNIFLDIGITNYINRSIASDLTQLSALTINGIQAKFILSLFYTLLIFIIAKSSGITDTLLLTLLVLQQILTSFLLFARGIISAIQLFKTDAFISVIDKALMIVLAGLWLYSPAAQTAFTIYHFAWLQLITIGITLFISIIVLYRQKLFSYLKPNRQQLIKIIRQSVPFALVVFLMGVHNRADAFLLERLHSNGSNEAGIYAAAYRLLDAANMFGYLFATILISYWSKHIYDAGAIEKSLLFSHQLLIPAGLLVAVIAFFFNQSLFQSLYHHENKYAGEILRWCLVSIVPYFITQLYGTLLTAAGKIKIFMWLLIGAATVNILLNIFFIPAYGARACVFSALTTQGLLALLQIIFVKKTTGQSVGANLWLRYLFVGVVLAAFVYLLGQAAMGIWLKLLCVVIIWLAMMNVLRIFSIKSFLTLVNEK